MICRKLLVVADDSPEFQVALRYACRRAAATGDRIVLLKVMIPPEFEHWSGVREEMERQEREEAEAELSDLGAFVIAQTGTTPEYVIVTADTTKAAIRNIVEGDESIRMLVLGAGAGGHRPGPLVESLAREGVHWGSRRLPVTLVPGDLNEADLDGMV